MLGYEVTDRSIGYLIQRAEALRWVWHPPAAPFAAADENEFKKLARWTFPSWISRMPGAPVHPRNGADTYMRDSAQTGGGWWLHGRVILNGWRVAKAELTMGSYTLEGKCILLSTVTFHSCESCSQFDSLPDTIFDCPPSKPSPPRRCTCAFPTTRTAHGV